MPYIKRDHNNDIVSIRREKDNEHSEFLSPTSPDIIRFLSNSPSNENNTAAKATLSESDTDFARATEDLIQLLIRKNMILFTDLPPEVQAKMSGREKLRSNLHNGPYSFLDDSDPLKDI